MNLGTEDEFTEFKQSLSQLDKGLKSLTAMLNKNRTGNVYFGVSDDGTVVGMTVGEKTEEDIRRRIKELIEPRCFYSVKTLKTEEGKKYILVHADGADAPYSCDGRYWIRNVKGDDAVSNELLRRMLRGQDSDLLAEAPSRLQDLTFSGLVAFLKGKGIHAKEAKGFYESCRLYTAKKEFNQMAFLLSDQNSYPLKLVTFGGTKKTHMVEKEEFGKKCLLRSVQDVLDYFRLYDKTKVDLSEGARAETPLFDYESFREAWINAAVHNDWTQGNPPSIYVYDDRMEIVSYGYIPYALTLQEFYEGTSMPVNHALFSLFMAAGFTEQSGHGVSTIAERYGRDAIDLGNGIITVTIPFAYLREEVIARRTVEAVLSPNRKKVLEYLGANPNSTLQDAANALGLSLSGVKKAVAKLTSIGALEKVGSKRSGKWVRKVDFDTK